MPVPAKWMWSFPTRMGRYIKAARITKARKRQGRLAVECCDGLPFLIEKGMTLHIVPPILEVPRTVVVDHAQEGAECTVGFAGISDYSRLVQYVGRYCLVARDDVDGELLAEAELDLSGFSVVDERLGELGAVVDWLENGFQATLVLEGPYGEVMVPFVDEFVLGIDEEAGIVRTRVPQGLVEG